MNTPGTVHEAVVRQARRTPERIAVVAGPVRLTYAELDRRSAAIARRLRAAGAAGLVGVHVDRDEWLVPALLGVLRSGAGYVPLDPAHPARRNESIAASAGVRLVLGSPLGDLTSVPVFTSASTPDPGGDLDWLGSETDIAYVIHTSGSAGTPKGVLVEHRNVLNFLDWTTAAFTEEETRGVLAAASVCFDASVWEIFVPLVRGGRVLLARDALAVRDLPARDEITMMAMVPSALAVLLDEPLPPSVRVVVSGGETLTRALCERVYANPQVERLINAYGPTETTVICVAGEVDRDGDGPPPIGRPITGATVSIRDGDGNPVPDGSLGELWVGGRAQARGYLNSASSRFTADGYRTGDLVHRAGGRLWFHGRADDQVKVRGHRIEPGEVEAALAAHPKVRHAIVQATADGLTAHAEAPSATGSELRDWLRDRLPPHMVPSWVMAMPLLPRSPGGKIDRAALAAVRPSFSATTPRNATERLIAETIASVLGVPQVGIHDEFAALGGHSLSAARVTAELTRRGFPVPFDLFLRHPTAAALTAAVLPAGSYPAVASNPSAPAGSHSPLTATQEGFRRLRELAPYVPVTTLVLSIEVSGPVTTAAVSVALTAITERHPVLRSVLDTHDGEPVLRVCPVTPVPVDEIDLTADQDALAGVRDRAGRHVFDLSTDVPLLRGLLARLSSSRAELVLVVDHMAFDGGSAEPLIRELAASLGALGEAARGEAAGPGTRIGDVARWERGLDLGEAAAYWDGQLAGAAIPDDLPGVDGPPGWESARVRVPLDGALSGRLTEFAKGEAVTPFAVFLAAVAVVVGGLTGRDDTVIGAASDRRHLPGARDLIGPLVTVLPLRVRAGAADGFRDLVRRCAATTTAALGRQDVPADRMYAALPAHRSAGAARLPVVISMHPTGEPITANAGDLTLTLRGHLDSGATPNELTFFVDHDSITIEYARSRFDAADMRALADRLPAVLTAGLDQPDRPLTATDLITTAERRDLLTLGTGPALPAHRPVVAAILDHAAHRPGAPAVTCDSRVLTYGQLADWSSRVAHGLIAHGVRPGDLVGVLAPRDHLLPAMLLAIWRAGAAYLPLEPGEQSGHVVLARGPLRHESTLDADALAAGPRLAAEPGAGPLAYVIRTSGSTGRPKIVELTHDGLAACVAGFAERPGIRAGDVMAAVAPLGFDMSAQEIWTPLAAGARCEIVERPVAVDGYALAERLASAGVTVVDLAPTALRLLLAAGWEGGRHLRVISGGEALDPGLAARLRERVGEVWNAYGPTECTITTTVHRVGDLPADGPVPIGRPVAGARCYVVDRHGRLAPRGVIGELWIGGAGVARGYRHPPPGPNPFRADPFGAGRLYRTGDRVRWRADGTLEFHGREDDQVKVRGYRIETAAIVGVLHDAPGVAEAAVTIAGSGGEARLVAHLAPATVDLGAVRRHLRERLPEHMVPGQWALHDLLPRLANGKPDPGALSEHPRPDAGSPPTGEAELLVAAVWTEVLGRTDIGAEDSFFALGGQSLAATRVTGRLRQVLGLAVPVQTLFENPRLRDFAAALTAVVSAS
ncbi:amino acid adenylation domain-containing protein [Actinoplanes sp. CA-054009]